MTRRQSQAMSTTIRNFGEVMSNDTRRSGGGACEERRRGVMTLEQCSKADLVWIINRMCMYHSGKRELNRALNELDYEKEKAKIEEAAEYAEVAYAKQQAYIDLLKPYYGMKFGDIPVPVLEKAAELQKQAAAADRKWAKLMGVDLSKPKKGCDG